MPPLQEAFSRRPFMVDPRQLASLDGQQYIVARPAAAVADFFDRAQRKARAVAPGEVTYPHTGHVTLRGFYEPHRVDELRQRAGEWVAKLPPLQLRAEVIDSFPAPFQIVIARLARTSSLVDAYVRLTAELDATDFRRIGELSVDEWIFHLSVAYGKALPEHQWEKLRDELVNDHLEQATETVLQVEFVSYRDAAEHRVALPLAPTAQ